MSSIVCSGLSFAWPDDTVVFTDVSTTFVTGRTGLVAPNGAGKSTLLRLIAGELQPTSGTVSVAGALGHLPQTLPLTADLTVADVLGVAPVIAALNALAAGDAGDAVFTAIGDDWDIEERARAQLDRLGLGHVGLDRRLGTLSGGEIVSLGLAAQLLERPDVLLLDEPTNNLDAAARRSLYAALDEFGGTLLLVSHDRVLLDRMDRIAELSRGEIVFYGGNFTAYREAVALEQRAAESDLRNAEQQLKREKRQMQEARERAARRANTAARNLADAGLPKILAGARKRRAQESAGKADDVHARRVGDARARVDDAERSLRDDDAIVLDLPGTEVPAGRNLFTGRGLCVRRGDRNLFAGNGIDLSIRGPERIALTGPNGAGKSTLLRIVAGALEPEAGAVQRADGRTAYISQRLDLLDDDLSVAGNLARFAPDMTVTRSRHLLAQFLFRGDRIHLPVSALSGGERLRATLACVLYGEPAPQLLLLDEPTNNLDLVSVGQLESALDAYRGAFVVVSHDERFLAEIGVNRWLRLADGALAEV
ncbi:ABC transporter [Mycobacterium sp. IS-1742]|uniref:ABC-F family ATP-binding cassette domain-containing protein n=1 Tax=Mycobacterium sp. IS-1742 TaxID=1772285 RepID=UPI0007400433|nr:ABC-F family ATP-binding cassette domain-containing protein [Mycobacterium sp. IS-1742]KUI30599.1 ABC transporter [Mycobacterium sp. IS-1742]